MITAGITPGSIGFVLNGFEDEIKNAMSDRVHRTEIDAGRQIFLSIENVKNAYGSSLGIQENQAPKDLSQIIEKIKGLLENLKSRKDTPQNIDLAATNIISQVPHSNRRPKLTLIYPNYSVVHQSSKEMKFKFAGNFPWNDNPKYLPSLILNGKNYNPGTFSTQNFEFTVPASDVELNESKRTYLQATLQIPWDNGWMRTIMRKHEYKVILGVLPTNPGTVSMEYTIEKVNRQEKHIRTDEVRTQGKWKQEWTNIEYMYKPTEGWNVAENSAKVVVYEAGQHGIHEESIQSDDTQVICNVKLAGDTAIRLGLVNFHVEFDQYKDEVEITNHKKTIPLGWGESTVISLSPEEKLSKFTFDSFDMKTYSFQGASTENPYLKISEQEGKFTLKMEVPEK